MPINTDKLPEIKFFSFLSADEREGLAKVVDSNTLAEDEVLFQTGEPGEALFIVRSGAVEISIKDVTGQKIVLTTAEPGDYFGEIALLDGGPRTATATARVETELLVLTRDNLRALFQKKPEAAMHMLAAMGSMTRKADELLQRRVSRNVNDEVEEQRLSPVVRFADFLAWFSGSMPFLLLHTLWFIVWIALNTLILPKNAAGERGFDPFPFGLLTMIVSLEAIFLSCFVLISANRQAEKDKVRSDIEYEVNIKAELEVAHLHEKTDQIYQVVLDRFDKMDKRMARMEPARKE